MPEMALVARSRRTGRGVPLKPLSENPVVRMLAVLVAIAAGIRLIYWLLTPVWPYLLAALVGFTVLRLMSWYRGRW